MENAYAQALIRLVNQGHTPSAAVQRIRAALAAAGRTALMPRIVRSLKRFEQANANTMPRLYRADTQATPNAPSDVRAEIDTTLIGGWRYVERDRLIDMSYKRQLLDIFNRATH